MSKLDDKELVHLITAYPPTDVFIMGLLQTSGIPVFRQSESIAAIEGITFGPLAEVNLYVHRDQEAEAREILAAAERDSDEE